ncbi:hypothetical protein [Polyangium jinanense]|uniref:Uncharacterized protein n=1 Tax=Polyangium jinanense TaxID=2829994 RepID=A0A9X4AZE4_9BACT|nr:hypothetical protein [Polyangium jinanense]MDC3961729.1 hypothetical protein [Polyangium jinanense]MDC3988235.1 hypothetical protein [Polyangium jinanense]
MTRRRSFVCFLAAAVHTLVAALAPAARAGDAVSSIAVVCAPGDRFGLRVQAELEALGFRTALLDPGVEPASRASLEATARKADAIAAIRVVPSERGVEVWVADRVTGKTVLREITDAGGSLDRDAALALRTVELLRASLLEVAVPGVPPGEVPATPELREKMTLPAPGALAGKREPPSLRLSLAPGLLLSPGGFGAAVNLGIGLAWMPSAHVGVSGFAAIPLTRPRVEGAEGSADLSVLLAGGGMRFVFHPRATRWAPLAELGIMAVSLESHGTANAGFLPGSASAVTVAPFVRVGLSWVATPMLRVRADILASFIGQGVSVQLAKHEVATWGKPIVLPAVGVDFGWF